MQRYFSKIKQDNKLELSTDDIYHIIKVMRMKTNDKVEVVYESRVYICEVNVNEIPLVSIKKELNNYNDSSIRVTLIVPLLKEAKMDLILQKATELGVYEIIPVIMKRSIVKLDDSKEDKKIERWTKICKEASEQSKRVDIPIVTPIKKLTELNEIDGLKLVCSTVEKEKSIKKFLTVNQNYDKINIVVGPEGGISEDEEELLVNQGFTRVSLGNRIMRVETVPIFILSALNYEFME
jgi:16S rRNA (uracil1498-N3)-methyltransferase